MIPWVAVRSGDGSPGALRGTEDVVIADVVIADVVIAEVVIAKVVFAGVVVVELGWERDVGRKVGLGVVAFFAEGLGGDGGVLDVGRFGGEGEFVEGDVAFGVLALLAQRLGGDGGFVNTCAVVRGDVVLLSEVSSGCGVQQVFDVQPIEIRDRSSVSSVSDRR
jgi:hypothetical protein